MIRVENLMKEYDGHVVLRGIDFTCQMGQVNAIVGPSGGGKSTFLRCLVGFEPFQGGTVAVGADVLTPSTHPRGDAALLQRVRRSVGFVFQQFNLFPHLTVLGNLIEAPVLLGEDRETARARALTLLERVGLEKKHDAWPHQLSGGQQQRVAIARTLVMRPSVILFDEPTSALDPLMALEVLRVMEDLAREGQAMVVVTHALHFARRVAHCVHVFAGGLDVEVGPPERIFEAPEHDITKGFLRAMSGDV